MTTVKHEEYWPAILADPTKYGQIQTADAAWNARAACVYEVLKNTLCVRDNAILTQQWENTLELSPADGATLNERKAVILYRLTEAPPLTIALLEKSLILLMGEGKAVVEHLPAENKLVVHTDRADDTQLEAVTSLLERVLPKNIEVERYNHHIEVSWRDIDKYAECVTPQELYEVDPEKNTFDTARGYQTYDICSDGTFPYITKLTSVYSGGTAYGSNMFDRAFASIDKPLTLSMPNLKDWGGGSSLTELILDAPNLTTFHEVYSARIRRIKCNSKKIKYATHLCWAGTLEVLECEFPELTTGKMTANAKLNKESALRVFNTIPNYTTGSHPLEIGIHVDHQHDEEVLEAIANAEAKGWTLTVRWNGTPTAQAATTYGLRKPPIYAKVSEHELPDGTTERVLEWGHYVTDPTGYEEFRSVEAAREYYGLPAEDEAITETE